MTAEHCHTCAGALIAERRRALKAWLEWTQLWQGEFRQPDDWNNAVYFAGLIERINDAQAAVTNYRLARGEAAAQSRSGDDS